MTLRRRVLPSLMMAGAACGSGPELEDFEGAWRLTSVNDQALPALGNATGGEVWLAAVLRLGSETGSLERCMEDPSTSTQIERSSDLVVDSVSDARVTLQYFDRRSTLADTATLDGDDGLTVHYRMTLGGQQALDVLGFAPLTGDVSEVCDLAPNGRAR